MLAEDVRRLVLEAICADTWLFDRFVLKGGSALALVYDVGGRSSLDLDFSMDGDFQNVLEASERLESVIETKFRELRHTVFDFSFQALPSRPTVSWWGGYRAQFKLIADDKASQLGKDLHQMRRQAVASDPASHRRRFSVEISKHEYTGDVLSHPLQRGSGTIKVYSPALLAAEKLRAIIQQHDRYPMISARAKRSRARDFYDIVALSEAFSVNLRGYPDLVAAVFKAKRVDMELLGDIRSVRALHEASWADVELSLVDAPGPFSYYFDYVASIADDLHTSWHMDSP